MNNSGSPHSFNGTRQAALLAALLAFGTAHAALVESGSGGPGGTLSNVGGTASLTSQAGSSSQSLAAGLASASVSSTVNGTSGGAPISMQLQSFVGSAGSISLLATTSYGAGSPSQGSPGSFVEEASWHATLVNTTGKTASFGVDLSGNSSYGPVTSGLQFAATASFGSQHYDVTDVRQGYAIDGVVLKPGESALLSLDYKIVGTNPAWAVGSPGLAYGGDFVKSFSSPVAPVPEPATTALMVTGLAGIAFVARRRKQGDRK